MSNNNFLKMRIPKIAIIGILVLIIVVAIFYIIVYGLFVSSDRECIYKNNVVYVHHGINFDFVCDKKGNVILNWAPELGDNSQVEKFFEETKSCKSISPWNFEWNLRLYITEASIKGVDTGIAEGWFKIILHPKRSLCFIFRPFLGSCY